MSVYPKSRVLIADDEYYFRQLLIHLIDWASIGFEIAAEAENGREALQMVNEQEIDIVIADIEMPQMSGLEFVKALRDKQHAARLIFITSYDVFAYAQQAVSLGADHYLLKPIDEEELEQALLKIRRQLIEEMDTKRYISKLKEAAGYTEPLQESHTERSNEPQAGLAKEPPAGGNQLIRDAMAFVNEHYADEKLSLQRTAQALFVNPSYLSHVFKRETGDSFVDYVTNVRLAKAMDLLRQGPSSDAATVKVATVARQVGYSDPFYFSKRFKKKYGITPNKVNG